MNESHKANLAFKTQREREREIEREGERARAREREREILQSTRGCPPARNIGANSGASYFVFISLSTEGDLKKKALVA